MMTDQQMPSREDLIALCERAVVPVESWWNRDSARSQEKIGKAWALLKAGCEWEFARNMEQNGGHWWIEISYPGFNAFEMGRSEREYWESFLVYIPTAESLARADGSDWY